MATTPDAPACRFCRGRGCLACEGTRLAPVGFHTFDGDTFDATRDGPRLRGALERVRAVMADGGWHTLRELASLAECSEAAASARIRDLRKRKFGGYTIEHEFVSRGLWRYRMLVGG